jgi:RNA polymerase sigma factor (sigma-70 family)
MIDAGAALTTREVAELVLVDGDHRAKLVAYARHLGIPREDADDLLQDTALELLRQRSRVHRPAGFVFTVFHARCARFLAARQMRHSLFVDGDGAAAVPSSIALDRVLALREALGTVSSTCRRLLAAYYVEGQSLRQAASAVALATSSVTKTMSRCLRRLRACLA